MGIKHVRKSIKRALKKLKSEHDNLNDYDYSERAKIDGAEEAYCHILKLLESDDDKEVRNHG